MANIKSEADSNLIATMDWSIPLHTFKLIVESRDRRGQVELKGCLRCKEFIWYLYLVNDGYIRLSLECPTTTEYCFPTLYYDLKFGGTMAKPYVCRKGPLFSLSMGPRQYFSYGTLNLLNLPQAAFQHDFRHFMPNNKLLISLKLYTFIELKGTTDVQEIQLYYNPMNESLINDLTKLLIEPKYSDVTIVCSGEALKAHKCILAARSTVFSKMFESAANEVTITEFDVSVIKLALEFIYTGATKLNENNLMELLRCAEKYDLNELKTACLNKMCNNMVIG